MNIESQCGAQNIIQADFGKNIQKLAAAKAKEKGNNVPYLETCGMLVCLLRPQKIVHAHAHVCTCGKEPQILGDCKLFWGPFWDILMSWQL